MLSSNVANIVSIDLDNLLPAIDGKPELCDEFVALGYYCNAKNIPFFVTTNRTQLESLKRMRNAVAPSGDLYEALYRQTLSYAKEKIKDAELEVVYCTAADAANAQSKKEIEGLESYSITSFEDQILVEEKQYCDDEIIFASGKEAWEGDEVVVMESYRRQRLYDNKIEQEALQHEKQLQETLHANKKHHFLFIEKKMENENKKRNTKLFHIDHSKQTCEIISGIEETKTYIQRNKSPSSSFIIKPFFTFRVDEGSIRDTFLTVAENIGLKANAEKLLESGSRLHIRDWILNLSLLKYLVDTQPDHIRVLQLIKQFEKDCLPYTTMNSNQLQIWNTLKIKVEHAIVQKQRDIEQKKEYAAVGEFFKYYDAEKNKNTNWFLRLLKSIDCFNLFHKSEWPNTQEAREKITIKDIILRAMKDPTDAYGDGGNITAQVLFKRYGLIVEQDPDKPPYENFSNAPNTALENTMLFQKTWYEYRQFEERQALSVFYKLRANQLPFRTQVERTAHLAERMSEDAKPVCTTIPPVPIERSLVSLVEATRTSLGTRFLAVLHVPGFFSGNHSYSIFSKQQNGAFGIDTRAKSKSSEMLAQELINSVKLTKG